MRFKLSPVGFTDVPTKKICPLGPRRSPRLVEIGLKARRRKTWAQLPTAAGLPRLHYVGHKMPERVPWPGAVPVAHRRGRFFMDVPDFYAAVIARGLRTDLPLNGATGSPPIPRALAGLRRRALLPSMPGPLRYSQHADRAERHDLRN